MQLGTKVYIEGKEYICIGYSIITKEIIYKEVLTSQTKRIKYQ